MAVSPTIQDEVAFISNVNATGTLAQKSYFSWNQNTPATYSSVWTTARKWGGTSAGTSGGTVAYYFDPASKWSATEQKWLEAGLALWSGVANIKFVQSTSAAKANITFRRTNDGGSYTYAIYTPAQNACVTGGKILGTITHSTVNIDTTGTAFGPISGLASEGGFTIENLLHEEGHALGLGHAGPYDGSINTNTQQYSVYDTKLWTVMSYINPGTSSKYASQAPVSGVNWAGDQPTTWMPLDILAIQRLYGVATTTPLSGGQIFGFHSNIMGALQPFFDFTQNRKPIITIWDKGSGNTLDLSGFTSTSSINLTPGTFSSAAGLSKNIAIAYGTKVDRLVCTSGGTSVTCNDDGDTVIGGNGADTIRGGAGNDSLSGGGGNDVFYASAGTDTIDGGAGTDTFILSGKASGYKIGKNASGKTTVIGAGINDTLNSIEVLKYSDKSVTLSGVLAAPASTLDVTAATTVGWESSSPLLSGGPSTSPANTSPNQLANVALATPLTNSTPLAYMGLTQPLYTWQAPSR